MVWASVEHIDSHVEWMTDATAIRFTTEQHHGVGTRFDCDTKVGPLKLVDHMEITAWEPERAMGVRHTGLVTGTGAFTLAALSDDRTEFTWTEELVFPWWLGGPVGALVGGKVVLGRVWRGNLTNLKRLVESAYRRNR